MKRPLLVLLGMFTCIGSNLFSQVFAHPGATWIFHHLPFTNMCSESYEIVKYVGDTTVLGTPAKQMQFTVKSKYIVPPNGWQTYTYFRYFNVTGDTISLYDPADSTWQELYNFSLQAGDSVMNPLGNKLNFWANSCPDSIPYNDMAVVTNTGTTVISGESLRYYTVRYYTRDPMNADSATQTFYERLITDSYWFPTDAYWCGAVPECGNPVLECYSDNDWTMDTSCNEIAYYETISIEEQDVPANVAVYPNPTPGNITVSASNPETWYILSAEGRLVFTASTTTFSIEQLPSGVYIITNSGRSWYKKIIKY